MKKKAKVYECNKIIEKFDDVYREVLNENN
jgi:hypothetical protein